MIMRLKLTKNSMQVGGWQVTPRTTATISRLVDSPRLNRWRCDWSQMYCNGKESHLKLWKKSISSNRAQRAYGVKVLMRKRSACKVGSRCWEVRRSLGQAQGFQAEARCCKGSIETLQKQLRNGKSFTKLRLTSQFKVIGFADKATFEQARLTPDERAKPGKKRRSQDWLN
jgi:hypothetical protein